MGIFGVVAIAIAALLASLTTANAGITAASRYPLAMSQDKILPFSFQTINHKFGIPHPAVIFTGGFMLLAVLFLKLETFVKVASTLLILSYILTNLSVIFMRESQSKDYHPKFRAPLYPWLQIAGIIGLIILIVGMGMVLMLISTLFIVVAFGWYWFYARARVNGK